MIASPAIFYYLWTFVAAGLHSHERRYVYIYLPVSVTLFVSGVVLAFFLVLHYVLNFLLTFNFAKASFSLTPFSIAFTPKRN